MAQTTSGGPGGREVRDEVRRDRAARWLLPLAAIAALALMLYAMFGVPGGSVDPGTTPGATPAGIGAGTGAVSGGSAATGGLSSGPGPSGGAATPARP